MSIRYIGSKARLINDILPVVGEPGPKSGKFVDAFCGTGVVAEAAARSGWAIRLNDHLLSAVTLAHSRVMSGRSAVFDSLGGYDKAVAKLNEAESVRGFIWREYSPASKHHAGVARMYFTESNAARIDGIRSKIAAWRGAAKISQVEERLLVADLLLATNRVANIAGTYGCYLSHWSPQSQESLTLHARELFPRPVDVQTSVSDVMDLGVEADDLVYLDPPYTKRQYAAYYHVLETITCGDQPTVGGITGLRPWQEKASDFCYRSRALRALLQLVENLPARRVLISYSDEGHVDLAPLKEGLSRIGNLSVMPLKEVGRYRPNRAASKAGKAVNEFLLIVDRSFAGSKGAVSK
ncbi:MAG: restriction endonuclease subunit M [Planctomycetota bacterium]|nr:MAG: restriction endonuclease subunit M [Planctomycetota bacterium]